MSHTHLRIITIIIIVIQSIHIISHAPAYFMFFKLFKVRHGWVPHQRSGSRWAESRRDDLVVHMHNPGSRSTLLVGPRSAGQHPHPIPWWLLLCQSWTWMDFHGLEMNQISSRPWRYQYNGRQQSDPSLGKSDHLQRWLSRFELPWWWYYFSLFRLPNLTSFPAGFRRLLY